MLAGLGVGVGLVVVLATALFYGGERKSISTPPSRQLDQEATSSDSLRQGAGQEAVELGEYVKLFMLGGSYPEPSWDLGADANTLPLMKRADRAEEPIAAYSDPDQLPLGRIWTVRTKVNGEVFWTLRQGKKEELGWEIVMLGDRRFGPAKVAIIPPQFFCLKAEEVREAVGSQSSSGCYFDIEKMFSTSEIQFRQLCEDHHTSALFKLYEVQTKGKKFAYVVYKEGQVYGEKVSWLALYWKAPRQTKDAMCGWLRAHAEQAERIEVLWLAKMLKDLSKEEGSNGSTR